MPRVDVPVQSPPGASQAVLTNTNGDAANDHDFVNDGNTVFIAKNGGGVAISVTIKAVACSHGRTSDIVQSVAAGTDHIFGPYPQAEWNQTNGKVNVDIDTDASLELIALRR